MDYSSQHGLSRFAGRKMMMFLCAFVLWSSLTTRSLAILTEAENSQSTTETSKSEITKREQSAEAQRREHSFNTDGTVNYHGSGSGHESGDLVPPPGGSLFNSPSIELSVGHTASTGPGLSNSYGLPIPADSYGPPNSGFDVKPPRVYGPPKSTYGPPSQQYGPPGNKYLPPPPPKPIYGPPKPQYRPPSPPKPVYGPPSGPQFGPPKPTYGVPKPIRPKPSFISRPKPVYDAPKPSFGSSGFSQGTLLSPVSSIKPQYGPPKISATYGTPLQPSTSYAPRHPKHGHIKTPPTPPVVKYDGWKPIPGLVSSAPSPSYGVPDGPGHGASGGFGFSSFDHISSSGFDDGSTGPGISFGSHGPPSSTYGAPSFGGTSFGSSSFGIQLKPVSTYGPPPKPSPSYGTPLQPSISYGPPLKGPSKGNFLKPPSPSYDLPAVGITQGPHKPSHSYGPPKPPSISYGVPQVSTSYGPPKPPFPPKFPSISYRPPKVPSTSYGPPKSPSISYGPPKRPSSSYGPPKAPSISYGPPKSPSSSYGPPKPPSSSYGPPSIPISSYSPPSFSSLKPPSAHYGPPKAPSSSYGPPKGPSSSYGPPKPPNSSYGAPQIFTTYSIPKPDISVSVTPSTAYRGPPVPHPLQPPSTYGAPSFSGGLYKTPLPPNALYGVPTGPEGFSGPSNTHGVPSTNIHAPVVQQVPSIEIGSQPFLSSGPGSAFPSQTYGAPLLPSTPESIHHPPASTYGAPTALPLRQPKNPVKFRPPVPAGLISSIGAKWGDSAVWGGNVHSHKFQGNTYIPPAVPDPDPGIHANQGNPLVIPPPSAPPINYGSPTGSPHHEVNQQSSHQFVSSAPSSSGPGDLIPPPPYAIHGQGSFDIQQSSSVELSGSNNLDHHGRDHHSQLSSGGVTSYNAPIDTSHHHDSSASVGGQSFAGGIENIPLKGNQGSYTLQIQAAGGNSGEHIPHGEVLSNGLLQDILSAIENPGASGNLQQYANQHSSDPVASEIGLNILKQLGGDGHAQQSNSIQYGSDLGHAASNNVPVYTQASGTGRDEVAQIPVTETDFSNLTDSTAAASSDSKIAHYLNKNQIALYYNNQEAIEERKGDTKDLLLVQMVLPNNSTSSQQPQNSELGALVSVKLQNAQNGVDNAAALKSAEKKR